MEIIIVRHGESEGNVKRIYPYDNTPLTTKGRESLINTKNLLKAYTFDTVICSPLTRATETMEVLELNATIEPRAREKNFGIFAGYGFEEISSIYPNEVNNWINNWFDYRIPKGESGKDFYRRVSELLDEISLKEENTLIIAHDGFVMMACAWVLENPELAFKFQADNGSITVIGVEDGHRYIKALNRI